MVLQTFNTFVSINLQVVNNQNNDDMLPWTEALSDCRKRGADLASFHSQEELNFIWAEHIASVNPSLLILRTKIYYIT